MRLTGWVVALLLGTGTAVAAKPPSTPLEASMLVTGHVFIEPNGSVSDWALDEPGQLPEPVVALVRRAAPAWRFEPVLVDGQARRARAQMSLRIVANQVARDDYRLTIRSAYFGKDAMDADQARPRAGTDVPQILSRKQPVYPPQAAERGFRGSVYVLLRIGRDGKVRDVIAEQVNLRTLGTTAEMSRMRDVLARSAISALREWTFQPPTTGEFVHADAWSGRVVVDYVFHGEAGTRYGEWHAYFPGPRQRAPWLQDDDIDSAQSPDTLVAGGFRPVGGGLRLLTPLQGG